MTEQRVADMTIEELRAFVDERIQYLLKPRDAQRTQAILDAIDQNLWTPPPGAKSTLELLREDRDA